jgi:NAD(P)-dependent dehydrogenase (short-subunit alcohol dehydrogenase family)
MNYQGRVAVVTGAGSGIVNGTKAFLPQLIEAGSTRRRRPVTVHCVHPGVVRTNFGLTTSGSAHADR